MNNVFLLGAYATELKVDDQSEMKNIPLWRRMTPLQKAVMMCVHEAVKAQKKDFEKLAELEAPLYFASAYGELGAMLRVTQTIEANALPISPKDFQHSVLNAALSYAAIAQTFHQPGFAISGGFGSSDLTLHLAARRIAAGLDAGAVVLHGHEYGSHSPGQENARAELLILSGEPSADSSYSLNFIDQTYDEVPELMREESVKVYGEDESGADIAWLLHGGAPERKRVLKTRQGLFISTHWHGQ